MQESVRAGVPLTWTLSRLVAFSRRVWRAVWPMEGLGTVAGEAGEDGEGLAAKNDDDGYLGTGSIRYWTRKKYRSFSLENISLLFSLCFVAFTLAFTILSSSILGHYSPITAISTSK